MTDEEAITLVTKLVCRGRRLDPSQTSATMNLADELGFDSLDAAELLASLHKETGRQVDVDSIKGMQTICDIAQSLISCPDPEKVS